MFVMLTAAGLAVQTVRSAPAQQAYLKASNPGLRDGFGWSVALSGDTLVVETFEEDSSTKGVNGNQSDNSDQFGISVAVSGDTVAVGAYGDDSNATGVNGDQSDNSVAATGAAYVFTGFCPSCPQLALVPDGSGACFLRFDGIPGLPYRLERALNVTGPWETIDTQTAPASRLIEYHETNPLLGLAFYRTVQP
jgi:hypothetical protein